MRTLIWKRVCILAFALSLMAAGADICHAQEYSNTPVTVSKEKVKIGGKICYSHIVLEKQTLYSISKAYEVSIDDIYRFNPSLKESGLKKNSIILIPSKEALQEDIMKEPAAAPEKVEEKAVTQARPEPKKVSAQSKERQQLLDSLTQSTPSEKAKGQKIHIRKWYEDLDMIAEIYGVSVESIIMVNGLEGRKLTKRQRLIIPAKESIPVPAAQPEGQAAEAEAEITEAEDTVRQAISEETPQQEWYLFPKNEVHATLLLPMRNAEGKLSRNNMDFYSGAMLAVYDLANEGVNTELNVYDISDMNHPVTKEDIEQSDLIIGPVSTSDLTRLLQASPEVSTVISPLDPRAEKLTARYSNMVQAPTPHKVQYQDLVNWIKEDLGEQDKVFMFSERISRGNDAVATMKEVMDSSGIEYTPFAYSILEGRDVVEPLKEMMTQEGVNRIYIASESEAFVNDVVRNLNLMLIENFNVVLYAPSKIRSFDTIEVEHFHKTSMHASLTYYINYDDPAVKDFLLKYRALYNTEPTQFAFQGYDIAKYFINLCYRYGKRWPEKLEDSEKSMLQSTFRCIRQGTGGYVNDGVRRIIYDSDWSIRQVR